MRKWQRNRKKVVIALITILCLMIAGYAAFSANLNITGTSNITSNWNVKITNIKTLSTIGSASNVSEPTYAELTANFSAKLVSPGDSITYEITVTNAGTLDAALENINISDTGNPAIKFTTSKMNIGDVLKKGESKTLLVNVAYDSSVTSQPENKTSNLEITLNYVQSTGEIVLDDATVKAAYQAEMSAIEQTILDINKNNKARIGTKLTENTAVSIRGINYYKEWYLVTATELLSNDVSLDITHANYIVRYDITPGAVISIPGDMIDESPVHTFNYFGDPEEENLITVGLLTAVTPESTKSTTKWGEMDITGGSAEYNSNGGLLLGSQYGTISVDQTRPVNNKYSVAFTVKGILPQPIAETFPKTIVAISYTSSKYLSWVGIRKEFLHVYSFYDGSAKGSIDYETEMSGFASIDLTKIVKETVDGNPVYYDFNNEYLNIQVTAERKTGTSTTYTNVYINGELVKTFPSGDANLPYATLTLGDLRASRGLKYEGAIYNFAFYSEVLSQSAINQNWSYFKSTLK